MRTYRDCTREVDTARELRRLHAFLRAGDAEAFLVDAGELEQGVVDALCAERDGLGSVVRCFRRLLTAAGAAFLQARAGAPAGAALHEARVLLEELERHPLPPVVRLKAPEGYMHYALDPAAYADAAARYAAEAGTCRARQAVVVGVRSIGTSLSGVVAAALGSTRTLTVRPRGASGGRYVAADRTLCGELLGWLRDGADVLIVDEGPGATGETFRCVAAWLESLGVASGRIVLFPSHTGGMSLAPEERRAWFAGARTYAPPCEEGRAQRIGDALGLSGLEDLSAGRWRDVVPHAAATPAGVHHERRKYRAYAGDGAPFLIRYVGLGRWGRAAVERAYHLADLGVGPAVRGGAGGFLALAWIDGHPARAHASKTAAFREALGAYLGARAGAFPTGRPVDRAPLLEALVENTREALGVDDPPGLSAAVDRLVQLPEREAFIADARLQLHEWLRTGSGYAKVDALDHGDGTRLPGPADVVWDVAGAAVEFELGDEELARLVHRCAEARNESPPAWAVVVNTYRAPYAACCLGEVDLSAREAADPAGRMRFVRETARYRRLLARELCRLQDLHTMVTRVSPRHVVPE